MASMDELKEKTGQLLQEGWKNGYLTQEEYTWRSGHLARAESVTELENLVRDLMDDQTAPAVPQAADNSVISVLGSRTVHAENLGRHMSSLDVLGSMELDYRGFPFTESQSLNLVVVLGETVVVLPPGVRVKTQVVPILGECNTGVGGAMGGDSAPVLQVTAVVILGSLRFVYRER